MAEADRKHADLDLQVSLLAEHEVTKIVAIVTSIADHLGLDPDVDREELEELKQHVAVLERHRRYRRRRVRFQRQVVFSRVGRNPDARATFLFLVS